MDILHALQITERLCCRDTQEARETDGEGTWGKRDG